MITALILMAVVLAVLSVKVYELIGKVKSLRLDVEELDDKLAMNYALWDMVKKKERVRKAKPSKVKIINPKDGKRNMGQVKPKNKA